MCEEWNGLDDDAFCPKDSGPNRATGLVRGLLIATLQMKMDDDVVAVGSVNAFKRKLDHHLRNVRVYF